MTGTLVPSRFVLRHDLAANWTAVNPILALGEEGYEEDTGKRKIGDGTTHWTSLAYMASGGGSSPDASPTVKGLVQLAGDIGGTAGSPTVPGLATKAQRLTRTSVKTADYTASAGDLVPVDTGTPVANVTITLPNAPASGTRVGVKHVNAGPSKAVAIACAGSDVFNVTGGVTGVSLTVLNQAVLLQYDTGIWTVVSDSLPKTSLDAIYGTLVTPDADTATTGTLQANKHHYVSAAGGNVSRALPTGQALGTQILLEKSDSGTNTVSATGSIRGVGSSTFTLTLAHESVLFVADSSGSWWPFVGHKTLSSLDARYQPLDSDLTAIAALAPADGQLLQWSTSLGAWTVVNPSGTSQLAYAENATGTAQGSLTNASGSVDLTNMTISVGNSGGRPVYLSASIGITLSAGTAAPLLKIIETTSGSTQIESSSNTITLTGQSNRITIPLFKLANSVTSTRTFKLQIFIPASGSATASVDHGASGGRRSTFVALAA